MRNKRKEKESRAKAVYDTTRKHRRESSHNLRRLMTEIDEEGDWEYDDTEEWDDYEPIPRRQRWK